jgi:hypothetical protein
MRPGGHHTQMMNHPKIHASLDYSVLAGYICKNNLNLQKKLVFYLNQENYASYPQMFLGLSYIYHVEVG